MPSSRRPSKAWEKGSQIFYPSITGERLNTMAKASAQPKSRTRSKAKSELSRIAAELQRAYNGDAWHGPPMTEALKGICALSAPVKPIPEAHSIWEIVHHLTAWNHIVRR